MQYSHYSCTTVNLNISISVLYCSLLLYCVVRCTVVTCDSLLLSTQYWIVCTVVQYCVYYCAVQYDVQVCCMYVCMYNMYVCEHVCMYYLCSTVTS